MKKATCLLIIMHQNKTLLGKKRMFLNEEIDGSTINISAGHGHLIPSG
jgi:hypothetical protein